MQLSIFSLMPGHRVDAKRDLYEVALERAALAEELGFSGFWVAEHHGRSVSRMPNPAVFLAAVAKRTREIRLGVAVAVLPVRDPFLLAEDYALVDRLSGGRLDLGIGSGISPVEFDAMGISMDGKRARFEESLEMMRHAWGEKGGAFDGKHRSYGDLFCSVELVQKPAPPIWRAVGSVDAAAAAGEVGDSVLFLTAPDLGNHENIAAMSAAHRDAWVREGRAGPTARAGAALFTCVAESDAEAQKRAAQSFDRMSEAREQPANGKEIVGDAVRGGRAFFGAPDTIVASLDLLNEAGISDVLLWHDFGGAGEVEIAESMRLLASAVAPRIV